MCPPFQKAAPPPAAQSEQLAMLARYNDGDFSNDMDRIGKLSRGGAMGEQPGDPALREAPKLFGPSDLGPRVHRAVGLIQQRDRRMTQTHPKYSNALRSPRLKLKTIGELFSETGLESTADS